MATLAATLRGRPGPHPMTRPETPPNIVALPLFHSGGQQGLLFAYHVGRSVILMSRFRAEIYAKLVAKYRVDSLFLAPAMVHALANFEGEIDLSSVKSVLTSGQELNPQIIVI